MKVKICGMKEPVNIGEVADLHPDYMGFIFYEPSKRYVKSLDADIIKKLPSDIKKTGVFVNDGYDAISRIVEKFNLDTVQLHGEEKPELCNTFRDHGLEVFKAVGVDEDFDFSTLDKYEGSVDYYLFDTKTSAYGGSGITFDWNLLERYPYQTAYILSGGIGPDTIKEIDKLNDHRLYAIDLNSRFELEPGIKDVEKVKQAINYIRFKEKK